MRERDRLDHVYDADRITGSTPPEKGSESSNIVGRPAGTPTDAAFHESTETPETERQAFDRAEALDKGGSYDGLGVPVVED